MDTLREALGDIKIHSNSMSSKQVTMIMSMIIQLKAPA